MANTGSLRIVRLVGLLAVVVVIAYMQSQGMLAPMSGTTSAPAGGSPTPTTSPPLTPGDEPASGVRSKSSGGTGGADTSRPGPTEKAGVRPSAPATTRSKSDAAAGGKADGSPAAAGADRLLTAIRNQESKVWVESSGTVVKVLADDREGDMHQRFLVELAGGQTIKIAHNIDLAPRVPAAEGDLLKFRGRFEWNDLGGVVHWTHRDPSPPRKPRGVQVDGPAEGWIELRGTRYR